MEKKRNLFQRISDFAKNYFAKDRVSSSFTNRYGETTHKTHRRSFETTNDRLLRQIGNMKEKESLVLDRNGHFIHLDKSSTKQDIDMFMKNSNKAAEIEKQQYSTWDKVKNAYNNRFEKKDIAVTFTDAHGKQTELTNRTMTRRQAQKSINDKINTLKPGQHLTINLDGKIHHLNHQSKPKEVSKYFNNSYPTSTRKNIDPSLAAIPATAPVLNQNASERQINFIKQSQDRSVQTSYRDTAFLNNNSLEKELKSLKAGETLTVQKNGKEQVFNHESNIADLKNFTLEPKEIVKNDKDLELKNEKKPMIENAQSQEKSRTKEDLLKTAAVAAGAGLATGYVTNKVSDNFLVKLAAVSIVTVATGYIANKYFTDKDFSFKDLANRDKMKESFQNAKNVTNNPELKPNDIKPDTWLQIDRETALKYSENSTPIIKEGDNYFVGLKTENLNESQISAHLELLSGKGLEKGLEIENKNDQQLSIA